MDKFLKEYIKILLKEEKKELEEAAIGLESALSSNHSLFIETIEDNLIAFTLVDSGKIYEKLPRITKLSLDSLIPSDFIGFVLLNPKTVESCRAYMVQLSAAEKGYGPLLYDIAMSWAKKHGNFGLVSDRSNVSNAAFNVWRYYNRIRKDVVKKDLFQNDNNSCISKSRSVKTSVLTPEEEEVLNKTYFTTSPINYERLVQNGHVLLQTLAKRGLYVTPEQISLKGEKYFWQKF